MLIHWRPLHAQISKLFSRNYKKRMPVGMCRMVHQETLRFVNPYARINVESDVPLRVEPADVFDYPNGNALIAQLLGDEVKNCTVTLRLVVAADEKLVKVYVKKAAPASNFSCDLKVPIRAEMFISAKDRVSVSKLNGETLEVAAMGDIYACNINATTITLSTSAGNIISEGTLLAKDTKVKTDSGSIVLDNLKGDAISCRSKSGPISVNSCYVDHSKFDTDTGNLQLKNVHKVCEVCVHQSAQLSMIGVHGRLHVQIEGGSMDIQLTELTGLSHISSGELTTETISISEQIQQNTEIFLNADKSVVDSALSGLNITTFKQQVLPPANEDKPQLLVCSRSPNGVHFKKQSWSDMLRQSIGTKEKES